MNIRFSFLTVLALMANNAFSMSNEPYDLKKMVRDAIEQIQKGEKTDAEMSKLYLNASTATEKLQKAGIPAKRLQEDLDKAYASTLRSVMNDMKQSIEAENKRLKEFIKNDDKRTILAAESTTRKAGSMTGIKDETGRLANLRLNASIKQMVQSATHELKKSLDAYKNTIQQYRISRETAQLMGEAARKTRDLDNSINAAIRNIDQLNK